MNTEIYNTLIIGNDIFNADSIADVLRLLYVFKLESSEDYIEVNVCDSEYKGSAKIYVALHKEGINV